MNIIEKAFNGLFPDKEFTYDYSINYSGRFKDYNANVRLYNNKLEFHLSKKWRSINPEIRIGLIQELLLKILNKKTKTNNIDLYNNFIKNLHIAIPKTKSDPILEDSFNRVNEKYFLNLEIPNMKWGRESFHKLGTYEYQTDTITISSIFKQLADAEVLDYIMYHELLHKKHKFKTTNQKTYAHTKNFKQDEKRFENQELIEKKLKLICSKTKLKSIVKKNIPWFF